MSANINVNLNHCELTPSAVQSAHGEFTLLADGTNAGRIMCLSSNKSASWPEKGYLILTSYHINY